MEVIFKNDWMQIVNRKGIYIIRYDSGNIGGTIINRVITEEEAMRAMESDEAAEKILNDYDNKELFGEDYKERELAGEKLERIDRK